jgi:Protein of unknown function (DUF4230)
MRVRGPKTQPNYDRLRRKAPPRLSPFAWMRQLMMATTGGAILIALIAGYAFWRSGPRFLEGLKVMLTPPPPEDTVDVRTIVVEQIHNASELTTAVFTMEAVVPSTSDRTLAGYVIGKTNLLYIAYGEVRAGIDLSKITQDNIEVTGPAGEQTLRLTLPAPAILDSKIDVTRSQVYDYDRGAFNLGPDRAPELQELAQKEALVKIEQAACSQGILEMANERAELVVSQLLSPLGYAKIIVETQKSAAAMNQCGVQPKPFIAP